MSPTDRTRTDGGAAESSPFDTVSDVQLTRRERYEQLIDTTLLAPARIAWSDWRAQVGIVIVAFYVLMGTVGVMLVRQPLPNQGPRTLLPFQNMAFPLGTTNLGMDILALIVHATPAMLKMITAGAVFSTVMASVVGTLSGYKGGSVDRGLMTITDILMTIPGLPLVIVLAVIIQPESPFVVGIILTINAWAGLARTVRSQVLTIREESYVEASRVMGIPTSTILAKDIMPNLMPYIAVNFVQSARNVIFSSVGLYFLGILPLTSQNWGVMLNRAYSAGALYTLDIAHWLIAPMITVLVLSLGLILLAQGADRVFNPRVRARHAETISGEGGEGPEGEESSAADQTTGGMA